MLVMAGATIAFMIGFAVSLATQNLDQQRIMVYVEMGIGIGILVTLLIVYKAIKNNVNCPISMRYSCTGCGRKVNQLKCSNCYE